MGLIQKPYVGVGLNKNHQLANGMVAGWLMHENDGSKTYNIVGDYNHGSLIDAVWGDGGLTFKDNEYVNVGSLQITTNEITIVSLVREIDGGDSRHGIAGRYNVSGDWTFRTALSNELDWYPFSGGAIASAANIINDNTWHFVAATHKSGEQRIYLDGANVVASGSAVGSLPTTSNDLYIGLDYTSGRNWYGGMRYVYIFNRVLTPTEIEWVYCEPDVMFQYSSLVELYVPTGAPPVGVAPTGTIFGPFWGPLAGVI